MKNASWLFVAALSGCAQSPIGGKSILVGMSEAQEKAVDQQVAPQQFSTDLGPIQDFGRAYDKAFTMQADLSRPSVANAQYFLYGPEAEAIRVQVTKDTTNEEEKKISIDQQ